MDPAVAEVVLVLQRAGLLVEHLGQRCRTVVAVLVLIDRALVGPALVGPATSVGAREGV
jgi:hypothetical protein